MPAVPHVGQHHRLCAREVEEVALRDGEALEVGEIQMHVHVAEHCAMIKPRPFN